jgi:hypothetical protein
MRARLGDRLNGREPAELRPSQDATD